MAGEWKNVPCPAKGCIRGRVRQVTKGRTKAGFVIDRMITCRECSGTGQKRMWVKKN